MCPEKSDAQEQDNLSARVGETPFPEPVPPSPFPLPPEPFPREPFPRPIPWPPGDWWRCLRFGPVSGRYEGEMTAPTPGRYVLDLRVDIDPHYPNSPVMNRVSGDIYRVYRFSFPGRPPISWRVYQESWIIDTPTVTWSRCQVQITGDVRYWQGLHVLTMAHIVIPWSNGSQIGPAAVTFTETGGSSATSNYTCPKQSNHFRQVALEIDVCDSINAAPLLPSYDTNAHTIRPAGLAQRTLSIEEAYREAGIDVSINASHTIINDAAPGFASWSAAELHDAMEVNFTQWSGSWPKWQMWGLLAGQFDNPGVGGIMFDAAAAFGGAGDAPERQGFAVFRSHQWFNNLPAGAPANQNEAWALRHFLYTYVHEAGHAFNFLHSWNKGRENALSWMNYDWRYDSLPGNNANDFWRRFDFRFDDEELIHIRHGDRASVMMGGDAWASGGHLESPSLAMSQLEGEAPIELLLRSRGLFDFMEPVEIELRLRNLLPDLPLNLDTELSPEYGGVCIYIQGPDGHIAEYDPVLCVLGTPKMQTLKPEKQALEGEDRYSQTVFLSYGSHGFYFDEPGEYRIRAIYRGTGDLFIPSNVLRIRIANPGSKAEDRLAQDFFSYQVGMSLYLNGSESPFLKKGMDLLETVADEYKQTLLGAKVAAAIANSTAEPFYRMPEDRDGRVMVKTHSGDPRKALTVTKPALELYQKTETRALNLPYHNLVRQRCEFLTALGDQSEAKKELKTLQKDLKERGVNASVLEDIKDYEKNL